MTAATWSAPTGDFVASRVGLIGELALSVAGQELQGRVVWAPWRVRQHVSDIKTGESLLEVVVHLSSCWFVNVSLSGDNVVHAAFR